MGLFDSIGDIFSGFFSPAESTSTMTRQSNWTPEQEALFKQLLGQTTAGIGKSAPAYPGVTSAPINKLESTYLEGAVGTPEEQAARSNALKSILTGTPAFEINPETSTNYYNEAFYAPAMREYETSILPQVMESASGAGFHSQDTLNSMFKSGADLETNLAAKRAELVYGDEQARRTALENAMGRQATLAGSPTNIQTGYNTSIGTAGTYARQIENEKIQGDLARWLSGESVGGAEGSAAYNPNTQLALALLGLSPYSYGTNTESEGAGLGYGMLTGFAQGLGSAVG